MYALQLSRGICPLPLGGLDVGELMGGFVRWCLDDSFGLYVAMDDVILEVSACFVSGFDLVGVDIGLGLEEVCFCQCQHLTDGRTFGIGIEAVEAEGTWGFGVGLAEFDGLVDVGPVEFVGLLLRGVVTASVTVASTTAASTSVSIITTTVTIVCSAAVVTKLVDEDAVEGVDDWRRKVEWRGKW